MSKRRDNERLEGNGASRLFRMINKDGEGTRLTVATVSKLEPFAIRIDGDPFDIDGDSLIIAEGLLGFKRKASLKGGSADGTTTNGSISSITWEDAEITYEPRVEEGDKVIVIIAQEGQLYYVMDKAV